LAKAGAYAVREAPVLCHNHLADLPGRPLPRFRPQRRYLLILNRGDGTGLLTWGPVSWHVPLAFWIKDRRRKKRQVPFSLCGNCPPICSRRA
jgi:hypothetical protein